MTVSQEPSGPPRRRSSRDSVHLAVTLVGCNALLAIAVSGLALMTNHQVPDGLLAIASGAIGSLGTLMAQGIARNTRAP